MEVASSGSRFGAATAGFRPNASSVRRAEKCRGSSINARSQYIIAEAVLSTFTQHPPSSARSCALSIGETSRARTNAADCLGEFFGLLQHLAKRHQRVRI